MGEITLLSSFVDLFIEKGIWRNDFSRWKCSNFLIVFAVSVFFVTLFFFEIYLKNKCDCSHLILIILLKLSGMDD